MILYTWILLSKEELCCTRDYIERDASETRQQGKTKFNSSQESHDGAACYGSAVLVVISTS